MKIKYAPLLSAGFHELKIEELEDIFVRPFTSKKQRKVLVEKFKLLVSKLQGFGINFEIWIDGSFTTTNPKPNDIDLVFFAKQSGITNLPIEEQERLWIFFNLQKTIIKRTYSCDIYLEFTEDIKQRSYWRGWFGFSEDEKPKGIARIFI